jgi:hypothetical protein
MRRRFLFTLLAWILWIAGGGRPLAQEAGPGPYRGFSIDDSAVRGQPDAAMLRKALETQIDIVLEVGLAPEIIASLSRIPLFLVPNGTFKSATPGRYLNQFKKVQISAGFVRAGRAPVLLHELMHGYHHEILPDGMKNAKVLEFYERAKAGKDYDLESHMMSNVGEFFACTATAYLYGNTHQEPFTRDKIREQQPVYYRFLKELFGPTAGQHDGTSGRQKPQ